MSKFDELEQRLSEAKGPDRELDFEICALTNEAMRICMEHWSAEAKNELTPRYTQSLDAAIAFAKAVCPDWHVMNIQELPRSWYVEMGNKFDDQIPTVHAEMPTLALAWVLCAIRSLKGNPNADE